MMQVAIRCIKIQSVSEAASVNIGTTLNLIQKAAPSPALPPAPPTEPPTPAPPPAAPTPPPGVPAPPCWSRPQR